MISSVSRGLTRKVRKAKLEANLLQQIRLLNIHEYQVHSQLEYSLMRSVRKNFERATAGS